MGFSRQEYRSGLSFPFLGIFLTQGLNPGLPHCRQTLYPLSHQGSPTDHKEHIPQVNDFSAFVCLGRCQNLESLKFFLKMPVLPQKPYSVFSIPNPSRAHCPWVVLGAVASPLVWQDNEWNSVLLFIQSSAMISHVTFSFSWRGLSCYFN